MIDEEITPYESKVGKMYIWPAYMLHRIPLKTTPNKPIKYNVE
jgi:hypothetical protein